jgi:murein DD-endopeptidase MepM/ murein hydrolase activator NlpD
MRAPLSQMLIRNPSTDAAYNKPGTNVGLIRRPLGGTRGTNVRGPGHHHQGWDLYAKPATPIFAIVRGRIAAVDTNPHNATLLGRYLTLSFDALDPVDRRQKTFYALYAHLQSASVAVGDLVDEGAILGRTGTSGNAEGGPPHLHFAVLRKPVPTKGMADNVDPGYFLGFHHLNFDLLFPNWNKA